MEELRGRLGRLAIERHEDPAVFWVRASGFVTPGLLRQDLARAEAFARAHPGGWSYVVDTSAVRAAHPANPLQLRRIPRLPHLERWVVVAPSRLVRALVRCAAPLLRPTAVVRTVAEARALCGLPAGDAQQG